MSAQICLDSVERLGVLLGFIRGRFERGPDIRAVITQYPNGIKNRFKLYDLFCQHIQLRLYLRAVATLGIARQILKILFYNSSQPPRPISVSFFLLFRFRQIISFIVSLTVLNPNNENHFGNRHKYQIYLIVKPTWKTPITIKDFFAHHFDRRQNQHLEVRNLNRRNVTTLKLLTATFSILNQDRSSS